LLGKSLVIILALLGGIDYFVYHANKKTTDTLNTAGKISQSSPAKAKKKTVAADLTVSWTAYTSIEGKFSLKYPATWVQPTNKERCGDILTRAIYLGPDANSVLQCGTDGGFGQVGVSSTVGTTATNAYDFSSGYKDVVKKSVTLNGVTGQRTSAEASGQTQLLGAMSDGTKVVEYLFTTNGNTYMAHYTQTPPGEQPSQDLLSDFDLMITKTLQFK